jgi:LacI family transcriptional regulator
MPDSKPFVTQRDLARKLGVSNATISLALRNSPRIAEPRRKEIQEMAEKLGYQPNTAAVALSYNKRTSKNIPIHASLAWLNLWPWPEDLRKLALFEAYWNGATACAEKFGYRLEEFALTGKSPSRLEKILVARGIKAVMLTSQHYQHPVDFQDFHWEKFSAVRTSRLPLNPALHTVTTDQYSNTMLAIDQMRAKGYKRAGFISFGATLGDRIWRFESGYLTGQQEIPESQRLPVYRLDAEDPASRAGLGVWMKENRPDAVLTLHPNVREILESLGYRAPDDVGLATVNTMDCNIEAGIDQNAAEIGRCAVLQLLSQLHDNDTGIPLNMREILIKGRWIDGPTLPDLR